MLYTAKCPFGVVLYDSYMQIPYYLVLSMQNPERSSCLGGRVWARGPGPQRRRGPPDPQPALDITSQFSSHLPSRSSSTAESEGGARGIGTT